MNSVALPTSATTPTLSAEGELIRQAARGEAEPFAELFRRHGQMAWRLAQAVAVDRDAAVAAVGNGFARSLRGARRHQAESDTGFRPLLLSAVYRSAMDYARAQASAGGGPRVGLEAPGAKAGKAGRSKSKSADAVLAEAAFRSLPERWRAAVWLSEVESLTIDRVAPILGVSAAVATQLEARGRRALAGRFSQAHRALPTHLGPVLRSAGLAMPAALADEVTLRWKAASSDTARFASVTGWLGERAVRPLWVSVGGLLGLGLIGLGLVGQHSAVPTGPATVASAPANGTVPGVASSGGSGASGGSAAFGGGLTTGFGAAATGAATTAATAAPSSTRPVASHPATGGTVTGPVATPPAGSTTPGHSSTSPGTNTATTAPKTVVSLAPVASVTQAGASTTVNLLPSSSSGTPAVSATVGCSQGVGLTIGTTTIGCKAPASTSSSTTPATSTVTGLVGTLSNTIAKL